jgi:ribonucleoside-diphosphate reductase alpha chain
MSFKWLNENSRTFLSRGYLSGGETAEERIKVIADTASDILKSNYRKHVKLIDRVGYLNGSWDYPEAISEFGGKFYEYMSLGYFSLSSPIWANFGKERALPVSCFGSVPDDDCDSIGDVCSVVTDIDVALDYMEDFMIMFNDTTITDEDLYMYLYNYIPFFENRD